MRAIWKAARAAGLSLVFLLALGGAASAHVTVQPHETTQGSFEVFTVRVPTEKQVPTVKVEVQFPQDVTISRFEPKPGWTYEIKKDAANRIVGVVWSGGSLGPTEFGEFRMQGRVGKDATRLEWRAIQTYGDGSVVEWTGPEGSDTPASVTQVKPAAATGVGAATGAPATVAPPPAASTPIAPESAGTSNLPVFLSLGSVVISVIALLAALGRRAA